MYMCAFQFTCDSVCVLCHFVCVCARVCCGNFVCVFLHTSSHPRILEMKSIDMYVDTSKQHSDIAFCPVHTHSENKCIYTYMCMAQPRERWVLYTYRYNLCTFFVLRVTWRYTNTSTLTCTQKQSYIQFHIRTYTCAYTITMSFPC